MLSPKEHYQYLKNIDNIYNISFYNIFEKYIIQNLKGNNKLIEINSTDQESLINSLNGGFPIPGCIYTFVHNGPNVIIQNKNKEYKFNDLVPVVFCMNSIKSGFSGINLNMLPEGERLNFLDLYYKTYKDFFSDVESLTENNKITLNKRFIEYVKGNNTQQLINVFNKVTNSNYGYGYRKYLFQNISKFRMIEYSEYAYIPFYMPKDAFRKMNYNRIQKLYYIS